MKGHNTITLNQASANEAFEEYLNRRLMPGSNVKVTSVATTHNGRRRFEVDFTNEDGDGE